MALTDGRYVLISADLQSALEAPSPTQAWMLRPDGTTYVDAELNDPTRWATPGAWPRFLGRTFLAGRAVDRAGGDLDQAAAQLTASIVARLIDLTPPPEVPAP